jgi:hypothetical protein
MNLLQLRKLLTNNRFHFSKRQEITNPHSNQLKRTEEEKRLKQEEEMNRKYLEIDSSRHHTLDTIRSNFIHRKKLLGHR